MGDLGERTKSVDLYQRIINFLFPDTYIISEKEYLANIPFFFTSVLATSLFQRVFTEQYNYHLCS